MRACSGPFLRVRCARPRVRQAARVLVCGGAPRVLAVPPAAGRAGAFRPHEAAVRVSAPSVLRSRAAPGPAAPAVPRQRLLAALAVKITPRCGGTGPGSAELSTDSPKYQLR